MSLIRTALLLFLLAYVLLIAWLLSAIGLAALALLGFYSGPLPGSLLFLPITAALVGTGGALVLVIDGCRRLWETRR